MGRVMLDKDVRLPIAILLGRYTSVALGFLALGFTIHLLDEVSAGGAGWYYAYCLGLFSAWSLAVATVCFVSAISSMFEARRWSLVISGFEVNGRRISQEYVLSRPIALELKSGLSAGKVRKEALAQRYRFPVQPLAGRIASVGLYRGDEYKGGIS